MPKKYILYDSGLGVLKITKFDKSEPWHKFQFSGTEQECTDEMKARKRANEERLKAKETKDEWRKYF